jgi:hypothetical protein
MRRLLLRIYWWLEKRIVPGLRYSQYHYHETLQSVVPVNCHWLDLGCGHQMFASWMTKEEQDIGRRASRLQVDTKAFEQRLAEEERYKEG